MKSVLTVALALVCVSVSQAGSAFSPTVRFESLIPVTVKGTHFGSRERVTVTVLAGKAKVIRVAKASPAGTFTLGFGTLKSQDRCSGSVAIVVVRSHGDRIYYKLPRMACPVAGTTNTLRMSSGYF